MREKQPHDGCRSCRHFMDDPEELEHALTGILILSSTYGSTRGSAGICAVTGRFHDPLRECRSFAPRPPRFAVEDRVTCG